MSGFDSVIRLICGWFDRVHPKLNLTSSHFSSLSFPFLATPSSKHFFRHPITFFLFRVMSRHRTSWRARIFGWLGTKWRSRFRFACCSDIDCDHHSLFHHRHVPLLLCFLMILTSVSSTTRLFLPPHYLPPFASGHSPHSFEFAHFIRIIKEVALSLSTFVHQSADKRFDRSTILSRERVVRPTAQPERAESTQFRFCSHPDNEPAGQSMIMMIVIIITMTIIIIIVGRI